jgi:hypothetical protein
MLSAIQELSGKATPSSCCLETAELGERALEIRFRNAAGVEEAVFQVTVPSELLRQ